MVAKKVWFENERIYTKRMMAARCGNQCYITKG